MAFLLSRGSSTICHFCSFDLDIAGGGSASGDEARQASSRTAGPSPNVEGQDVDEIMSPSRGKNYKHVEKALCEGQGSRKDLESSNLENLPPSSDPKTDPDLAVYLEGQLLRSEGSSDTQEIEEVPRETEEVSSSKRI